LQAGKARHTASDVVLRRLRAFPGSAESARRAAVLRWRQA